MTLHRCPKCGATYETPGRLRQTVSHPCPKTDRHGTRQIVRFVPVEDQLPLKVAS
jgi:predicted RNA-binding Zn-ribbon protein involved in translation (DUF1610 family)